MFDFIDKFAGLLELAVDRGVADVGHGIDGLEFFHGAQSDEAAGDFTSGFGAEFGDDFIDEALEGFQFDRALLAGFGKTAQEFVAVEGFGAAAAFEHTQFDLLEDETAFRTEASRLIGAQIVQKIHAMSTPGGDPERRQERLRELQGIMRNRRLLAHENVFFTPHVGFNSVEAIERINLGTIRNIKDFIGGRLRPEAIVGG